MQIHLYCPALAVEVCEKVRNSAECAKNSMKSRQNVGPMNVFHKTAGLKSVSLAICCPFIPTLCGNRHILVLTVLFSKLIKPIQIKGGPAGEGAKLLFHSSMFNYEIQRNFATTTDPNCCLSIHVHL